MLVLRTQNYYLTTLCCARALLFIARPMNSGIPFRWDPIRNRKYQYWQRSALCLLTWELPTLRFEPNHTHDTNAPTERDRDAHAANAEQEMNRKNGKN